ncbi:MAG: hypothetical protein JJ863_04170 [Deltaproteobacteria bacterium]|nr:hypothetical protein [Deltaproteobacteria bacterium]
MLEQERLDASVSLRSRRTQRGGEAGVGLIRIGAGLEQQPDGFKVAGKGSSHQREAKCWVGPRLKQARDSIRPTHRCQLEKGIPKVSNVIDLDAAGQDCSQSGDLTNLRHFFGDLVTSVGIRYRIKGL